MSQSELSVVNESTENSEQAFDSLTPSESGSSVSGSSITGPIKSKIAKPSSLKLSNTASPSRISRPCSQAPKPALPPLPARSKKPQDVTFKINGIAQKIVKVGYPSVFEVEQTEPLPVFTDREKTALLGIIEQYKHIVTSQRIDMAMVKMKARTWIKIKQEFSLLMQKSNRTSQHLKKLWEELQKQPETVDRIVYRREQRPVRKRAKPTTSTMLVPYVSNQSVAECPTVETNGIAKQTPSPAVQQPAPENQLEQVKLEQEKLKLELLKLELKRKTAELFRDFPHLE